MIELRANHKSSQTSEANAERDNDKSTATEKKVTFGIMQNKLRQALITGNQKVCPAVKQRNVKRGNGGEGGIRTHGTLARTPVFKTGTFNHSVTSPGTLWLVRTLCDIRKVFSRGKTHQKRKRGRSAPFPANSSFVTY